LLSKLQVASYSARILLGVWRGGTGDHLHHLQGYTQHPVLFGGDLQMVQMVSVYHRIPVPHIQTLRTPPAPSATRQGHPHERRLLHDHRVPIPRETLGCKPVSVACEPSLWPLLPTLRGNGFWTPETEGPKLPLKRSFFPAETASRPCGPAKPRGIRQTTGNLG